MAKLGLVDDKAVSKRTFQQWLPYKKWTKQRCLKREGIVKCLVHWNYFTVHKWITNLSFFFEGDKLSVELLTSENSGKVSISKKAMIKIGMKIENFILIFLSLKAYNIEVVQSL